MVHEGPKASCTNGKTPTDLAGLFQVGLHKIWTKASVAEFTGADIVGYLL